MDEPGDHPARREVSEALHNLVHQHYRRFIAPGRVGGRRRAWELAEAVSDQLRHVVAFLERQQTLERADANMPMAEASKHGGTGRRWLVAALQCFTSLDDRECFRGTYPERFEQFRCQYLANCAFQREAAIAVAAPRRLPGTFGPEIEEPTAAVAQLGVEKPASVAQVGVINPELMAVVTQGERPGQVLRQRFETPEMSDPARIVDPLESHSRGPSIVAEPHAMLWKTCRFDRVREPRSKLQDDRIGAIASGLRFGAHPAIVGFRPRAGKARRLWMTRIAHPRMDQPYHDRFWNSPDGLKLHFRDYPGSDERPPVLCLHGLTRNARDFERLAQHIAGPHRVIAPDMRGRGDSAYAKDSATYNPKTYVSDVLALLAQENIDRFVAIGTSLGGLMTMLLAAQEPARLAGAVLNDIGPVVDPGGIDRIRSYVGQSRSFATWMHAARALEEVHAAAHPGFAIEDWLAMAKRCMVVQQNGRIAFDYDMAIAEPFRETEGAVPPDMWPAFDALADVPLLIVRGALSDLLTSQTLAEMQRRRPDAEAVTITGVGHAPTLDEPEAVAAIERLLVRAG